MAAAELGVSVKVANQYDRGWAGKVPTPEEAAKENAKTNGVNGVSGVNAKKRKVR